MADLIFKTNLVPETDYDYNIGDNSSGSEKRWNFYGKLHCYNTASFSSSNDTIAVIDSSNGNAVAKSTLTFYPQNDTYKKYALTQYGTWEEFNKYTLPTASSSTLGGIKVNGNGLKIESSVLKHSNSITAKTTAAQMASTLTWGGTFTIYEEKYDANGHITGVESYNMTMPANPNTDTQVNVTSNATSKAYLLGTTTTPTGTAQAVTTIADTGVYLTTDSGKLHATTLDATNTYTTNLGSTSSKVTNAYFTNIGAASYPVTNAYISNIYGSMNGVLTIGGKSYSGSENIDISVADLGLSSPMEFKGISITALSPNATTSPITLTTGSLTPSDGDVVLDQTSQVEYVFADSKWNALGLASSYSLTGHWHGNITHEGAIGTTTDLAVVTGGSGVLTTADLTTNAPSASGNATAFITSVSQDSKGKITATKASLDTSGTWSGTATKATQDGSGNTITTTYVKKSGDTMTGSLTLTVSGATQRKVLVKNETSGIELSLMTSSSNNGQNHGLYSNGYTADGTTLTSSAKWILYRGDDGEAHTPLKLYGAVWNDYAEYRQANSQEPGRCVIEQGDDTLVLSTTRIQPGAEIISDTFGFAIGKTEKAKTPIATTGRVLAYPYEDRELFRQNIGKPVCSGPEGTVSIMSDEEYATKGYCAIGFISAVPDYEEWGEDKIKVNGRVWIRVR